MKYNPAKRLIAFALMITLLLPLAPQTTALGTETEDAHSYSDSFEQDSAENFLSSGADFSISGGKLSVSRDGVVGLKDKTWYNGTYEVDINISGKTEWAGIQFCKPTPTAQRDEAGYMLYLRANGSLELYTGKNGVLKKATVTLGADKTVSLKVVTLDGVITVFADGTELFEVQNSDFTYGYFSFVNYMEGTVVYDNLKITCPASDGIAKEIFLEMPDYMVALGKEETIKLDLNTLPLDASTDNVVWKLTDVYGNPSTLATISKDGYVTAGNATGAVRVEVTSSTDATVTDYIEFAITEEAQRNYARVNRNTEITELFLVGEYGCNTVATGSSLKINACATPYIDVSKVLTYTVANADGSAEALASIDKNGVLTAGSKTGKVIVTAAADNGVSASVTIDIVENVTLHSINITANKSARVMAVGKEMTMHCSPFPANAALGAIDWQVYNTDGSPTDLASISADGVLNAEKCGTVRIRASVASNPAITSEWIMTISEATNNGKLVVPTMKYSFFAHYVADLTTDINGVVITDPNKLANAFDVEAYADKMAAMGCEYIVFTAWHYRMVCLYDSAVMTKWGMDNHRTDRDLLGEMIDAVNARGINVVLYTHAFDGYDFKTAEEGLKVGWGSALKPALAPYYDKDFDHEKWNNFVNEVYAEVMERYGDRICGVWVDEGNMFEGMSRAVDFDRLIATITSYNENVATFQNDHGFLYGFEYRIQEYWKHNEFADYTGARMRTFKKKIPNPIISNNWWTSVSTNSANAVPYEGKVLFRYQVLQSGASSGGGIQWAAGPYPGEGCLYEPGVCEAMEVMNAYLNPIAWTVKNTLLSTSYPTKENRNIKNVGWGIATQSADGSREYIHVLNSSNSAVDGNTLTLPVPADGKVFSEAYLATNNKKVTLLQNETGVSLTLPDDETWDAIDTVIEMKVKIPEATPVPTEPAPTEAPATPTEVPQDTAPTTAPAAPTEAPDVSANGNTSFAWWILPVGLLIVAAVAVLLIIKKTKKA